MRPDEQGCDQQGGLTSWHARRIRRGGQVSLPLSPLVTSYSAPVTMFAASEASKTAAGEMSSSCSQPTLSGTVGARLSPACCGGGCSIFCPCSRA